MSRFSFALLPALGALLVSTLLIPTEGIASPAPVAAPAPANVLFILDSSGSMWERVDGQPKVTTAKKVLNDLLAHLPRSARVGLMTYGHRRKGDCADIEILAGIGKDGPEAIAKKVNALQPKGETPIAAALLKAREAFQGISGPKIVVLVTDGAEECHGDPCAAGRELAAIGLDVHVNVVGFHLGAKERAAVECVAREGRGKYYDAADAKGLTAAMAEVKTDVERAGEAPIPEPAEPSLLSPSRGGQVIAAPNESWKLAISGKPDDTVRFSCAALPAEAIFAFQDEKPASFSKFQILVPRTGQWVKDFELLVSDGGPTGTYRPLGKFTTQNLRILKSPYQEFSFPQTTARYLKLRILSGFPGDCADLLTQIRLIGANAAGTGAGATATGGSNLLAPSEGGQVIAAPKLGWEKSISGKETDSVSFSCARLPVEAVYAFKDERPATISRFEMLIPATGQWVKDFELSAADDLTGAGGGAFRPIGKFTTQNLRLVKGPYQEFSFSPVAARYVKLKITSAYAGDCDDALSQIRLFGTLAGNPPAPGSSAWGVAAKPGEANLLASSQGGEPAPGTGDNWKKIVTGKDDETGRFSCAALPTEAVFAFRSGKPATFSRFEILIPSSGQWVKGFELLAGDDSPTGAFRSLGKFEAQNTRLFKTPYQQFRLPQTTARYLKFKVLTGFPGDCDDVLTQIRLMGKPGR